MRRASGKTNKVILPSLTPQDTARLAGVRLEFPLRIEDAEPMGFATDGHAIFMSTASMAFFDDVAMASAWLQLNGYSQQSLTNYALMLRYGRMEGRTKPPRAALCVPEDAETILRSSRSARGCSAT